MAPFFPARLCGYRQQLLVRGPVNLACARRRIHQSARGHVSNIFIRRRGVLLFCSIARALDRIGDRWTLLILRDLHAGPARFSGLQSGLTGIAPNLLTERFTLAASEGEMPLETFVADHLTLDVHTPGKEMELMTLLGEAMAVFAK